VRRLSLGLHRTFSAPLDASPRDLLPWLRGIEVELMTESWKDEAQRERERELLRGVLSIEWSNSDASSLSDRKRAQREEKKGGRKTAGEVGFVPHSPTRSNCCLRD
jgi:hypothetical protein